MIVVYTPADGEPQHYDASTLRVSEASIVQRTIDMKWQDILRGLEVDDLDAMRGIVWVLLKRAQPSLRFGEFDPGVSELTTIMDDREVDAYIDNALRAADTDLSPQDVAEVLLSRLPDVSANPDRTRARIAEKTSAPKAQPEEQHTTPQVDEDPSPSQTSSTPEPSTSDSSPTSFTSPQPTSTS
ncbi:hypothetical protein OZK63_21020 [Streptomyces sp. UMAF16]|nr:hypothetical protein [Streptomyces sp. UMAF16]